MGASGLLRGAGRGPERSPGETMGLRSGGSLRLAWKSPLFCFTLSCLVYPHHSLLQSQGLCRSGSHPAPPHFTPPACSRSRKDCWLTPHFCWGNSNRKSPKAPRGTFSREGFWLAGLQRGIHLNQTEEGWSGSSFWRRLVFLLVLQIPLLSPRQLGWASWAALARSPPCPEWLPSICLPSLTSEFLGVFR